jgi:hypothetical protein
MSLVYPNGTKGTYAQYRINGPILSVNSVIAPVTIPTPRMAGNVHTVRIMFIIESGFKNIYISE